MQLPYRKGDMYGIYEVKALFCSMISITDLLALLRVGLLMGYYHPWLLRPSVTPTTSVITQD